VSESAETWLNISLSVAGLVVSVGGFWIAIAQIRKTTGAVNAASAAIQKTERHLALNQLLVLIPQLLQIEADLEVAVGAAEADAVGRLIRALAARRR